MATGEPTVQRYRFYMDTHADCFCDMEVSKMGSWVEWDEYAALKADHDKLARELEALYEDAAGEDI